MKTRLSLFAIGFALIASTSDLLAQFTSGSTGAYGPMDITTDTVLDMPEDGIFHCTTITIAQGATLRFRRNSGNTPIYLLGTGNVSIRGPIDISGSNGTAATGGQGGPGGFDGGSPGNGAPPGTGGGPGGGVGGNYLSTPEPNAVGAGAFRTIAPLNRPRDGRPYGSRLLIPLVGGSGGGGIAEAGYSGGGGGGGAILIATNTRVELFAPLYAYGGAGVGLNAGSGGAIRIIAPVVAGSGSLNVQSSGFGAEGRTRVDCLDRSNLSINGVQATGSVMVVFPTPMPKLTVTRIAGNNIADGTTSGVDLLLPSGTPPAQTITVRARNFGQAVPIRVALLPENGDPIYYDVSIDNTTINPADATVNITVPINQQVRVQVWTR